MRDHPPLEVLIAGGGCAALEAMFRLQRIADSRELIAYDALLVAVGGLQRQPAVHTLGFGSEGSQERMHGLVQDLETGYVRGSRSIATHPARSRA